MQCPECFGRGMSQVDCPNCGGGGSFACVKCGGNGYLLGSSGQVACSWCKGSGQERCTRCNGSGVDPRLKRCAVCGGSGQITQEQHAARQQETRRQEAEATRRADEAKAEAARRYAEDAPRREAVKRLSQKESQIILLFFIAVGGGLLGLLLYEVLLSSTGGIDKGGIGLDYPNGITFYALSLTKVLLLLACPAAGAAFAVQVFFGTLKFCLVRSFLLGIIGSFVGYVVGLLLAMIVPMGITAVFVLSILVWLGSAWGASRGAR